MSGTTLSESLCGSCSRSARFGVQIMTPAHEGDPAEPKIVPPEDWFAAPAKGRTSESLAPASAGLKVS